MVQWGHTSAQSPGEEDVPAAAISVALTASAMSIEAGEETEISAVALYADGSQIDVTRAGRWGTSDAAIATVNGAGQVSGIGAGPAVISFYFGVVVSSTEIDVGT